MDFQLAITGYQADMTFTRATDIRNNVWLSLSILRGSWWFNPAFGMRDTRRLKNTERTARLVRDWVLEALQWIIDIGRATDIHVEMERDIILQPSRLKTIVTVTQPNGATVTFSHFFEVV